jgi:hypothetical protein
LLPIDYYVKLVEVNKPIGVFFNQPAHHFKDFNFKISGGNIIFFPKEVTKKLEI